MFLLKLISIKDIRYLFLIALLGYGAFLFHQNKQLKKDNERVADNYKNALQLDSLKVAIFKVTKQHEINDLLSQNHELSNLVDKSKIKTKRIQMLYYQQQKFVDSLKRKQDVSGLVSNIRKDIPAIAKWKDSTACLKVEGAVSYKNDSLTVTVNKREFNNNVVLIKSKSRRKPVKWLFNLRLGPRDSKFTPQSKCGTNKVTIINKVD